jgi:hypothetical protein
MSKTAVRYRYEQQEAERRSVEEEKLAAMTPEERKAYEDKRHKDAVNALSTLAMVNAYLGDNKYYK